ncbi:transcription factor Adf-1-like [Uloborus diversus]|uniref:transcription factor Adf-1-like n=1 Tax=Uloborus diversus TaxID=327109 RepID=UPI00240A6917|nr:transcription factor Adf-1-like [Uloborus diversus]
MSETNSCFNESLICEVRKYPWLWNNKREDYRDQAKRTNSWKVIGNSLNVAETFAKKRWGNLRDQYQKKKKEAICHRPSGSGGESSYGQVKWKYFYLMTFLEPTFEHERPTGNLEDAQEALDELNESQACSENSFDASFNESASASPVLVMEANEEKQRPNKKPKNIYQDELLSCLKGAGDEDSEKSSEYYYMMSLVPRMAKLPPLRQSHVRLAIERIFLDEETRLYVYFLNFAMFQKFLICMQIL